MDRLYEKATMYNMKINIRKTKAMRISSKGDKPIKITLGEEEIEQVSTFKYLGVNVTSDGRSTSEIITRIAIAKKTFVKKRELLTRSLSMDTKKKIVKSLIWSTLLYGSESWTLMKRDIERIESFEMWIWRRILKISWRDKITNEEVLRRTGEGRNLKDNLIRRKKTWIGHVIRGNDYLTNVIEGAMEGRRARGRPRKRMLDELAVDSYATMKRKTSDRRLWRAWIP